MSKEEDSLSESLIVMLNKMQLWPEDNLTRPKSVGDCLNKLADTPDNIF